MRKSVLIVEDNPDTRKLFRDLLEIHGFDTYCAADGSEALRLARRHLPDLILMDVRLPGPISGLEAAGEIKRDRRLRVVPIVAVTALAMPGDRERLIAAGFDGYLSKPVSISQLLDTVAAFIHSSGLADLSARPVGAAA